MADVAAAILALQESAAAQDEAEAAAEGCCISDGEVATSDGAACCSGSSGSLDSCCTIDGSMVFSDNSPLTSGELSASDAAALDAASCCWENEPVTYGDDWLGCI